MCALCLIAILVSLIADKTLANCWEIPSKYTLHSKGYNSNLLQSKLPSAGAHAASRSLMSCVSCCRFLVSVSLRSCWTCGLFSLFTLSFFFTLLGCFLCFPAILKDALQRSMMWSVQQSAPLMVLVIRMSLMSRRLVMMKSIRCQCLDRGCIQVALWISGCSKSVFVMVSSSSEHRVSRRSPLEFSFPMPWGPSTDGHAVQLLTTWALKLPSKSNLSFFGVVWEYKNKTNKKPQ